MVEEMSLQAGLVAHPSPTYVFPEMAVLPDQQPPGLHLQFEPPDGLDHGLGCEELAGGATEAVQLPSGRVGAQGHLLFGGGFGHAEVVVTAHGNGHSAHCTDMRRKVWLHTPGVRTWTVETKYHELYKAVLKKAAGISGR